MHLAPSLRPPYVVQCRLAPSPRGNTSVTLSQSSPLSRAKRSGLNKQHTWLGKERSVKTKATNYQGQQRTLSRANRSGSSASVQWSKISSAVL